MNANACTHPSLIGVGMGPGDPSLVTLAAVDALRAADAILVPSTEASGEGAGRAEQLVLAVAPEASDKVIRIPFSMCERTGVGEKRRAAWEASADAAVDAIERGADSVVFATVGDPSVYSTFSYLAAGVQERVPGVEVRVVPGITAMQALAAASRTPLVEGRERLTLVPLTAGLDALGEALDHADTVVAYKGGRRLGEALTVVRDKGRDGVLGEEVGTERERLTPLGEVDAEASGYFSTILVTPTRTSTGGAL